MRTTFASLLSALAKRTLAVSDEFAFMKDTKWVFECKKDQISKPLPRWMLLAPYRNAICIRSLYLLLLFCIKDNHYCKISSIRFGRNLGQRYIKQKCHVLIYDQTYAIRGKETFKLNSHQIDSHVPSLVSTDWSRKEAEEEEAKCYYLGIYLIHT